MPHKQKFFSTEPLIKSTLNCCIRKHHQNTLPKATTPRHSGKEALAPKNAKVSKGLWSLDCEYPVLDTTPKKCRSQSSAPNRQSFQLCPTGAEKCPRDAKASRKSCLLFRMEIFVGTYMRPRFSPCQASRDTSMKLKSSPFLLKGLLSLNLFLFSVKKSELVFSPLHFGVSQLLIQLIIAKSA